MVIDSDNRKMFEVFCDLHPIEAYYLHPKGFCDYVKKQNPYMSVEDIQNLIKECEDGEKENAE